MAEFGHDHYTYIEGQRMLVGMTRTIRPGAGETGEAFRHRVADLVQPLLATGRNLNVDEELHDGNLVQVIVHVEVAPTPSPPSDHRIVGRRRPGGPRGPRVRA